MQNKKEREEGRGENMRTGLIALSMTPAPRRFLLDPSQLLRVSARSPSRVPRMIYIPHL